MIYFETEYSHAYLSARKSTLDGERYMFGKDGHFGQLFIAKVEDIIHFVLGHYKSVSLSHWIDVEKGIKLIILGTFV